MPTLRPSEAKAIGLSRSGFYRAARNGELERIAWGIYVAADAPPADWDWLEGAGRRPGR